MFCPRCGQERISRETSFCSRCGFLLSTVGELLLTEGVPDANSTIVRTSVKGAADSPRWRGVKQGLFMILLMIFLAPLIGIFSRFALNIMPWPVGIVVFLFGGGGLLRIIYALMFESKYPALGADTAERAKPARITSPESARELPAGDIASYIAPEAAGTGAWLDTNDLQPNSVTDPTTKLLEKNRE